MEIIKIQPWGDMWRVTYTKPENGQALHYCFKTKRDHPDEMSVYQWWLKYSGAN
jgi:hypothetical protein